MCYVYMNKCVLRNFLARREKMGRLKDWGGASMMKRELLTLFGKLSKVKPAMPITACTGAL